MRWRGSAGAMRRRAQARWRRSRTKGAFRHRRRVSTHHPAGGGAARPGQVVVLRNPAPSFVQPDRARRRRRRGRGLRLTPGESTSNPQTTACGTPDNRRFVVTTLVCFFTLHARLRMRLRAGVPRASFEGGGRRRFWRARALKNRVAGAHLPKRRHCEEPSAFTRVYRAMAKQSIC